MSRSTLSKIVSSSGKTVVYMTTGGMEHLVQEQGGECSGFSIRSASVDSLLIIRAVFDRVPMVSFVGAATGAGCLVKAHRELRNGGLKWRVDKYRT